MKNGRWLDLRVLFFVASTGSLVNAQLLNYSDVWTKSWGETEKLYGPDGQAYSQVPVIPVPFDRGEVDQIRTFEAEVAAARGDGLRVMARLPFDYQTWEMNEYIESFGEEVDDHAVVLLDGTVQVFPWNGNQRFCSNSPRVREGMNLRAEVAVDAGADFISVDLQRNSADNINQGACFCRHCTLGFREFMKAGYSMAELSEMGIQDIDTFSYRQFLLDRNWTLDSYKNQAWKGPAAAIPLFGDFLVYHYRAINEAHKVIADFADAHAGKSMPFLSSSDPSQVRHTTYIPEIDGFVAEGVNYWISSLQFRHETVLGYKIGDAVGKPSMITAGPRQWLDIQDGGAEALARTWIAQAYANGTIFLVPIRQWTNPGFYDPDPAEFLYMYDFVRDNRELFEGYETMAEVGLLYSHLGSRYGKAVSENAVVALVENNIPFELIFVGDDLYERPVDEAQLAGLEAIVITDDFQYLNREEKNLFNRYADKTVHLALLDGLWSLIPRSIEVSVGNGNVSVTPREKNGTEMVFHLVNSSYSRAENGIIHYSDFTVSVSEAFSNRVKSATLFAPRADPVKVNFTSGNGLTVFEIPFLGPWAILQTRVSPPDEATAVRPSTMQPERTALLANYPNPFNPETWIPYRLHRPARVRIRIYDVRGALIRTLDLGRQPAGSYLGTSRAAYWDGRDQGGGLVASGLYFLRLQAGDFGQARKMMVLK